MLHTNINNLIIKVCNVGYQVEISKEYPPFAILDCANITITAPSHAMPAAAINTTIDAIYTVDDLDSCRFTCNYLETNLDLLVGMCQCTGFQLYRYQPKGQ